MADNYKVIEMVLKHDDFELNVHDAELIYTGEGCKWCGCELIFDDPSITVNIDRINVLCACEKENLIKQMYCVFGIIRGIVFSNGEDEYKVSMYNLETKLYNKENEIKKGLI